MQLRLWYTLVETRKGGVCTAKCCPIQFEAGSAPSTCLIMKEAATVRNYAGNAQTVGNRETGGVERFGEHSCIYCTIYSLQGKGSAINV